MKIQWLGHAAFLITSSGGVRIITDPYAPAPDLRYAPINEAADFVTVSHGHGDHGNTAAVRGNPQIIRGTTEAKGIKFQAVRAYHDEAGGRQRGANTIFCFEIDGVKICHLGDIGHQLSPEQVTEIGSVDVLMIPVGGFFTVDAAGATKIGDQLQPKVIIPMHYKTDRVNMPIAGVDDFLRGKVNVTRLNSSEIELKAGDLPANTQIMVLKAAK